MSMDMGNPTRLHPTSGGNSEMVHQLPVAQGGDYTTIYNNIHGHNGQFLYSNGELTGMQSSQFPPGPAGMFANAGLNWSSQRQLPQQIPQQPPPYNPTTPEHPFSEQQFTPQINFQTQPDVWPSSLDGSSRFSPQQDCTVSPALISNNFLISQNVCDRSSLPSSIQKRPPPFVKKQSPSTEISIDMNNSSGSIVSASVFLQDCPNVAIHTADEFPELCVQLEQLGYLFGERTSITTQPNKKVKLSVSNAASPIASPKPIQSVAKAISKQPVAPKSKIPSEPGPRLRYLLQECLDADDDAEVAVLTAKAWKLIEPITAEQTELVTVAVGTILKTADDETLQHMGSQGSFSYRLRKWVVYEHNKDKKSPIIPKMLKLLSSYRLSLDIYKQQVWGKVLDSIQRKSESEKSKEFAAQVMTRFQHLEKERARQERDPKKMAGTRNTDKSKPAASMSNGGVGKKEAGGNLNPGVKRAVDDITKSSTSQPSKKATATTLSVKSGKASTSTSTLGIEKKPTSSAETSTTNSTVITYAKPKPVATSVFFKSLGKSTEPAKSQSKAPEAKTSAQSAPSEPTTSFTSIFAQLKQRQQDQDREKEATKAAAVLKAKEEEKKKKKTVRWKAGDDLVQVQLIEWQEPEGEYYGGGSGMADRGWSDNHAEGVALRNRTFVEEEVELMEWIPPQPILYDSLYRRATNAKDNPEKRGGVTVIQSEEAKIQAQRNLVTLASFYNSPRDIPFSPREPDESGDSKIIAEPPTIIPLPDEVKIRLGMPVAPALPLPQPTAPQSTNLPSLLSAMQQSQQPAPQIQPNPAQNILATLQAFGQLQQPAVVPQPPQVDFSTLFQALGSQSAQMQQPAPQPNFLQNLMQQNQQQNGHGASAAVADLLSKLTSGMAGQAAFPTQPQNFAPQAQQQPQSQKQHQPPPTAPRGWSGVQDNQPGYNDDRSNSRDVRRELRDAVGWSDGDNKESVPAATSNGTASGGGKWGGKHGKKKDKKQKHNANANHSGGEPSGSGVPKGTVLCVFFQKGSCKHGDSCRFSHDPSAFQTSSSNASGPSGGSGAGTQGANNGGGGGGGNGGGGGGWKGKKKYGHVSRGVDQGASASAVGWPGAAELEY